jgi:hypothetical protein
MRRGRSRVRTFCTSSRRAASGPHHAESGRPPRLKPSARRGGPARGRPQRTPRRPASTEDRRAPGIRIIRHERRRSRRPATPASASGGQGYPPWTRALRDARRDASRRTPKATRPRPGGPGRTSSGALHLDHPGAARPGDACATGSPHRPEAARWEKFGRRSCDEVPRKSDAGQQPPRAPPGRIDPG